jgi:hypothetical protein
LSRMPPRLLSFQSPVYQVSAWVSPSPNTVQLGAWIVVRGGPVGWGQVLCRARLTCHLTYLRLMSRGLLRCRRAGLSRRQSSTMAWRQP